MSRKKLKNKISLLWRHHATWTYIHILYAFTVALPFQQQPFSISNFIDRRENVCNLHILWCLQKVTSWWRILSGSCARNISYSEISNPFAWGNLILRIRQSWNWLLWRLLSSKDQRFPYLLFSEYSCLSNILHDNFDSSKYLALVSYIQ